MTQRKNGHAPRPAGVLVVDDDEHVRRLCVRCLQTQGFHVVEAGGGLEAIELITHHAPDVDVVVTDILMPEVNGIELAARLRVAYPNLPVVLMSGYAPLELFRRNAFATALPLLRKPFIADQLCRTVRNVLGHT
jgi:DNA-binding NtrC family response regulator